MSACRPQVEPPKPAQLSDILRFLHGKLQSFLPVYYVTQVLFLKSFIGVLSFFIIWLCFSCFGSLFFILFFDFRSIFRIICINSKMPITRRNTCTKVSRKTPSKDVSLACCNLFSFKQLLNQSLMPC